MKDDEIIELYFRRNERAIQETDFKYGNYLESIADNILNATFIVPSFIIIQTVLTGI